MSWPKVNNAINSTTNQFGANDWGNLISDYYNGVDVGLIDPSKKPLIGTLTTYKFEKLVLQDTDGSHTITFSVDNISTGTARKIKFREQVSPYETDYALLEALPQTISNKGISGTANSFSDIPSSALTDQALFVRTNVANIFTTSQTIQHNTTFPLTIYRTSPMQNASNIIVFDSQNSDTIRKTFLQFNVLNSVLTPGAERGDVRFNVMQNGTVSQMLRLTNNLLYVGVSPTQVAFDPAGLTELRTVTFQNASGKLPLLEFANIFTATQKIQLNSTVSLTSYHATSVVANGTGISFNLQNSSSLELSYAYIFGLIAQNTAGSEQGSLAFYTRNGASMVDRMLLTHDNKLRIGTFGTGVIIDPTGISGSNKTVTFPNENIKALGEANVTSITNKQIDVKSNTFLRHSRYGAYRSSEEVGAKGEGSLSGLVGIGTRGTSSQNTAGKFDIWSTRAVANDAAGLVKLDSFTSQRISNPLFRFAFLFESSANRRVFKGLGSKRLINTDSNTAPLNSAEAGIFFGHGVGDTNWQIFHNDTSGVCVKTDTGIAIPGVATNYIIEIQANDSTPNFVITFYSVVSPGTRGSVIGTPVTISSDIPEQTTSLYLQDVIVTTDGSIQSNKIHYVEVFA